MIKRLRLAISPSDKDAGRWQTGLIPKRNYTGKRSEICTNFLPQGKALRKSFP
jgi:hypothetical protein